MSLGESNSAPFESRRKALRTKRKKSGKKVFAWVSSFCEIGVAAAAERRGRFYLINLKGERVSPVYYYCSRPFYSSRLNRFIIRVQSKDGSIEVKPIE